MEAGLVSPTLPESNTERCLSFLFNAFGQHVGSLAILDEQATILWQHGPDADASKIRLSADKLQEYYKNIFIYLLSTIDSNMAFWVTQEVTLPPLVLRFVVRATRGGTRESDDKGDIAVDDFMVENGPCYDGEKLLLTLLYS